VYAADTTIGSTTGAYAENPLIINTCFNINGGASAIGFTKYMQFYTKAFVLGARIIVKIVNGSPTVLTNVGVCITTNNTTMGSHIAAIENGMVQWDVVQGNPDHRIFTESVEVSKFLNKPRVLDDPQLFCTAAANPAQVIVAHIFNQANGVTTSAAFATYEILFDVVFTDPIPFT